MTNPPGLRLVIRDGTNDKYMIDIVCIKTGRERDSYDISEVVDLRKKEK